MSSVIQAVESGAKIGQQFGESFGEALFGAEDRKLAREAKRAEVAKSQAQAELAQVQTAAGNAELAERIRQLEEAARIRDIRDFEATANNAKANNFQSPQLNALLTDKFNALVNQYPEMQGLQISNDISVLNDDMVNGAARMSILTGRNYSENPSIDITDEELTAARNSVIALHNTNDGSVVPISYDNLLPLMFGNLGISWQIAEANRTRQQEIRKANLEALEKTTNIENKQANTAHTLQKMEDEAGDRRRMQQRSNEYQQRYDENPAAVSSLKSNDKGYYSGINYHKPGEGGGVDLTPEQQSQRQQNRDILIKGGYIDSNGNPLTIQDPGFNVADYTHFLDNELLQLSKTEDKQTFESRIAPGLKKNYRVLQERGDKEGMEALRTLMRKADNVFKRNAPTKDIVSQIATASRWADIDLEAYSEGSGIANHIVHSFKDVTTLRNDMNFANIALATAQAMTANTTTLKNQFSGHLTKNTLKLLPLLNAWRSSTGNMAKLQSGMESDLSVIKALIPNATLEQQIDLENAAANIEKQIKNITKAKAMSDMMEGKSTNFIDIGNDVHIDDAKAQQILELSRKQNVVLVSGDQVQIYYADKHRKSLDEVDSEPMTKQQFNANRGFNPISNPVVSKLPLIDQKTRYNIK